MITKIAKKNSPDGKRILLLIDARSIASTLATSSPTFPRSSGYLNHYRNTALFGSSAIQL